MARIHPSALRARFADWPKWARIITPFGLGAFAALGHEGDRGFFFIFVGFALAFLIVPAARRAAAWFGWLLGLGYFGVTLRWLIEPFLVDPVRHGWMAPFAILLMAGGLALFWAAAFWVARWIAQTRPSVMLWLPIMLAAAELARGHVFTGFPWGMVSYVMVNDVTGIWLTFVGPYGTNLVFFGLIGISAYCLHRGWTLIWPALAGFLFLTIGLNLISAVTLTNTGQTVRIIQPNAPQHLKWDREWMPVFFDRAIGLTRQGDAADVVIWPETSVPALLNYADPWLEQMSLSARGAPVVAGIQRSDGDAFYNSAILIDGPQTVAAISDKAHLVPFGEYIPLASWLEPLGLGTLVDQVAGFDPGTGDGLMEVDGLGLARVLICYEGIFPEEMQRTDLRPDVLLIITNDAWFGTGPGPRQHLKQAQARALETGLPVVRSANTGISAVIDARGKIVAQLPLNEAGALDALVPAALPPTIYARIGDWPLVVLLCALVLGGVASGRRFAVDETGARG